MCVQWRTYSQQTKYKTVSSTKPTEGLKYFLKEGKKDGLNNTPGEVLQHLPGSVDTQVIHLILKRISYLWWNQA